MLGQHFLADKAILGKIIDAASIQDNESVCEAGTGNGVLTAELCKKAAKVCSYEIDKKLFENMQKTLLFPNLVLENKDLFKTEQKFDVFVSNLPYSRSRDAFEWLATRRFDRAVIMVQKEFADKLFALPGDDNYRAITVVCALCFDIKRLFKVGRNSFNPPPSVESEVLHLVCKQVLEPDFVKKINMIFSKRNKKAASVAKTFGIVNAEFGQRRIDQLGPEEIMKIAKGG
jgi:16S rRNA (adenine1518-N6/adenine1519-N6)-dimethyltransferase